MLKRKVSLAKQRPSMSRITSKPSNLSQRNGCPGEMPKTRFNLNDRSISSPRLKSFPAERIRRIDSSPIRNLSENAVNPAHQMTNSGQGDTLPDFSYNNLSRSIAMPNQNITSMSDQEVSRNVRPMVNHVNQSDLVIPSGRIDNTSIEKPHHRPFVPNIPHNVPTLGDHSPRKFLNQRANESMQISENQMSRNTKNEIAQLRDPWKIENDSMRHQINEQMENSSEIRRPNVISESREIREHEGFPRGSLMTEPNISNLRHVADLTNSSQIHSALRSDVPHYCSNENCRRRQFSGLISGMTSPQDFAINQTKNNQRSVQLGSCVCASHGVNNSIGYNQTLVIDNAPLYYNHSQTSGEQGTMNQHNLLGNWQHATPQQYYNQHNEISSQNSQKTSANTSKLSNQPKVFDKKKSLRFSPSMIRDQEFLVTTMRQQGINEDIMRRQFDTLLAEQRKQLLYLEQLENHEIKNTKKLQQGARVQRKISRIEEDGKPEWMLHITPPRIPYSVVEKMQSERQIDLTKNSNVAEMTSPNHTAGNQSYDHGLHENYQHPWQMTGSNVWQQQPQYSYVFNNAPNEHQAYVPNIIPMEQYQQRYYGYPVHHQHQSPHHYEQNVSHESRQNRDNGDEKNQSYEQQEKNAKPIESSSLLKLRVYKEVIKRQKQNNGLQDPETIKDAMEALKNPMNRRGLEYLENLNKKREKPVSLNGAQDPHERTIANIPDSQIRQPTMKVPSANGLENSRNPNNPSPPRGILRHRKIDEYHASEYPRQRTNVNSRDCYSLMAEKENGCVAMMKNPQQQGYSSHDLSQNKITHRAMNMHTRSENAFHYSGQMHPGIGQNDDKNLANRTVSMPFHFIPNGQPRYYAQQMPQYYEHRDKNHGQMNPANRPMIPQSDFYVDQTSGNVKQQELSSHRKNNNLHEPLTIGGVKYHARKPEYTPNTIPMQPYPMNHPNNFNPMIASQ